MKVFSGIPFFRILIPYCLGILLVLQVPFDLPYVFLLVPLAACLVLLKFPAKPWRYVCLLCADLFLLGLGCYHVHIIANPPFEQPYASAINPDSLHLFYVQVKDVPIAKPRSYKCEAKVLTVDTFKQTTLWSGKLLIYLQKSELSAKVKGGDYLLLQGRLRPAPEIMNPHEFDYRTYLADRNISATLYVDSHQVRIIQQAKKSFSVWQLGLDVKCYTLEKLRTSALSPAAYGICAALLTGYDDDIDRSTVNAFAHSGTLHVLSVSGLHTGLIYACLIFLFRRFDRKQRFKITELVFCTVCLWTFALITGFSAPVLRAVIMFNLLAVGKLFFRNTNRNQLNILATSAFCLLLWNPFLIKDLGFLLSYGAMFGLLYFQPAIQGLWQVENKIAAAIWTSTTASVSATLSTLPLTLFYFKQFPLWFALCNLLVVPATFVMLLLAFLLVLGCSWLVFPLNLLTDYLIKFISLFDSVGFGFLEGIDVSFTDACFMLLLLILFSVAWSQRSAKSAIQAMTVLCVWQIVSLVASYGRKNESEICVFSLRKAHGIAVKAQQDVYLQLSDTSLYAFSVQPYLTACNYPRINKSDFNVVKQKDQILVVTHQSDSIPNTDVNNIQVLVLGGRFRLRNQHLKALPALQYVILDGTNKPYVVKRTRELCRNFKPTLKVLSEGGACVLQACADRYEIKNWR